LFYTETMRRLRIPAVLALTLISGASCTKGTGPEVDASLRDGRGSAGSGDAGMARDAGPADGVALDAIPDTPLG
jgi:hypothetical protein